MERVRKHIPNRLKKHRMIMGYKKKEVAYLLGFSNSNRITGWEQGRTLPSVKHLIRLSIAYRTLIAELYPELFKALQQEINQKTAKLLDNQ